MALMPVKVPTSNTRLQFSSMHCIFKNCDSREPTMHGENMFFSSVIRAACCMFFDAMVVFFCAYSSTTSWLNSCTWGLPVYAHVKASCGGCASSVGCDGWRYETHAAPLAETLTLHNCTDYPPGANTFLRMYLKIDPTEGDVDFKFPCQYVYDQGLCSNVILQGLCAHSCTVLKVAVLQGNITKYQDTDLAIDYAAAGLTEPPNMGGPDGK